MKPSLTAIVLTKNNQKTLPKTLESLEWADSLIVLDDTSTDDTCKIAQGYTPQVFTATQSDFAGKRTEVLEHVQTDWLLYIDADEVVTPELKKEILNTVTTQKLDQHNLSDQTTAFTLLRHNYFLGTQMYPDRVHRLFVTKALKSWQGSVHETPLFTGRSGDLNQPLLHYSHTDITSMLAKTNHFSEYEAQLRLEANHPPVSWWRLARIALTFAWQQFGQKKVWRYGRAGWFEGCFQIIDKLIVYVKLWERQQKQTHA